MYIRVLDTKFNYFVLILDDSFPRVCETLTIKY